MKALRRLWASREAAERRFFDPDYYLATYPDVALARIDGFAHFMTHGWREGRNPSQAFATLYYRDRHLDGRRLNPLIHYAVEGKRLGLSTAPASPDEDLALQIPLVRAFFSEAHYRARAAGVEGGLLQHYLRIGWRENIAPSPSFDPDIYLASHAFVKALDVSPLYHFASQQRFLSHREDVAIQVLRRKQRANGVDPAVRSVVAARFDEDFYKLENSDVRAAGVDPLDHFLEFGWRENRAPARYFDCAYYLERNPDVAQSDVNPFYHYLAVGEAAGLRPNPIGSAPYAPMLAPCAADWDGITPASSLDAAECVVIMPVYRGRNETLAAIHALLTSTPRTAFAFLVVNDGSPEPLLVADLEALAAKGMFAYESHDVNLGFVRTVNAAMARLPEKDVVLLNSDARVFGDWLDRLLAHTRRDRDIATVTPLSNNATIASYPLCNVNNTIEMEHDAAGLDALAARCNAGRAADLPTGVGFCLFITATSRAAIGLFDEEVFGRGYGEENDFSLRAARAGWRNVLAEDVFVYHLGELSFGIPQERRRLRGQRELIAKHPDYPDIIGRHLGADPSEMGRIRLDLMRLVVEAAPSPIVHVLHGLRGGVATHVDQQIGRSLTEGRKSIRMRVGAKDEWSLDIASASPTAPYCPNLRSLSVTQHGALIAEFLQWLAPGAIHIHSLAGLGWSATSRLFDLVVESQFPYHCTLHDYSAFCHRHHLVQPNGRYCGLGDIATCRACIANDRTYPEAVDPSIRRAAYARLLEGATEVRAPSHDIKARLEQQGARYPITVRAHEDETFVSPIITRQKRPEVFNVVTIGAIGVHKGSRILLNLARDAKARDLPIRFHVVGYSDIGGELAAAGVVETGRYERQEEAAAKALDLQPSCIFLPSIWPETFCYALSLAFALHCPPIVFDIGAQAERVRAAGVGWVLTYDLIFHTKALNNRLLELHDLSSFDATTADAPAKV